MSGALRGGGGSSGSDLKRCRWQTSVKMQGKAFIQRKAAAVLCILLLMMAQQVHAGPPVPRAQPGPDRRPDSGAVQALRRIARMTPLWRIMNSKPLGAYCQNKYECSSGLCRDGHCATSYQAPPEPIHY